MPSPRHVVKKGETLWGIAQTSLGDGARWPRIWRYNNRPAVIKVTGKGIPDPDLIYIGQVLLIPKAPQQPISRKATAVALPPAGTVPAATPAATATPGGPSTGTGPLSRQLPEVRSPISIKYRLDDLKFPPIVRPGVIMEVRMTGDILLMTQKTYPAVYVTQRREVELQVTSQANRAFGTLFNDTRLVYDSRENRLTYRSMFVTQSSTHPMWRPRQLGFNSIRIARFRSCALSFDSRSCRARFPTSFTARSTSRWWSS